MDREEINDLAQRLSEPFHPDEVKWKPQAVSGSRAMAIAYVNARVVMERLDEVMGIDNWRDEYALLPSGDVQCQLSLRINGEWITKSDIGGQSEQPDEGDRLKSAFSDALKRTAVKFGISRYLYRLPITWVDYDTQKKRFIGTPTLPKWAMPQDHKPKAPEPRPTQTPPAPAEPPPATRQQIPTPNPEQKAKFVKVLEAAKTKGMSSLMAAWEGMAPAVRESLKDEFKSASTHAINCDRELLEESTNQGVENFRDTWKSVAKETRAALTPLLDHFKELCQIADGKKELPL